MATDDGGESMDEMTMMMNNFLHDDDEKPKTLPNNMFWVNGDNVHMHYHIAMQSHVRVCILLFFFCFCLGLAVRKLQGANPNYPPLKLT